MCCFHPTYSHSVIYDCFCLDSLREPLTMENRSIDEIEIILAQTQRHEYRYFRNMFDICYFVKISHCPYCDVDGRKRF